MRLRERLFLALVVAVGLVAVGMIALGASGRYAP